jgi:hypothetical protein
MAWAQAVFLPVDQRSTSFTATDGKQTSKDFRN